MEEKQLKRSLIEIAQSLYAKFGVENSKDDVKVNDYPHEILTIRAKRGRPREDIGIDNITRSM